MESICNKQHGLLFLALLGSLLFPEASFADKHFTLEVTESFPPTYESLSARVQEAVSSTTWEDEECVSVTFENRAASGPAYRVSPTDNAEWLYFVSEDNQVIFLSALELQSSDVGLEFAEGESTLTLCSDFSVQAPLALSAKTATSSATSRLLLGVNALRPNTPSSASIVGDLDFASGEIDVQGSHVRIQGKGIVKTLTCMQEDFSPTLVLLDSPENHRSSFLYAQNLSLAAGTIDVKGETYNAWLWARHLASEGSGEKLSVTGNGALILGDAFDETTFTDIQNGTGALQEITSILGSVALEKGSVRPTLLTRQMDPATQGIGAGTVCIGNVVTSGENPVTLGSDSRWVLLYDTALQTATNTRIAHESGAQLVIYGWDGIEATLPIGWEEGAVSLVEAAVPRGQVRILDSQHIQITREWMQKIEALKAKELVKVVEDGWGTIAAVGPGRSYIAMALEAESVGRNAFVNLVDTSVALPFASGIALASERSFEAVRETVMDRPLVRTDSALHYWAEGGAGKIKAKEAFGAYGIKADAYRVGLGADLALKDDWMASVAVFGVKLDGKTQGNTVPIASDASMVAVSALAEKRFEETALRFSLTGARSSATAKRVALRHILKSEPTLNFASAAVAVRTRFGEVVRVEPQVGFAVNFAKAEDADVKDTGTQGGISGTGFTVDAKKRVWGEAQVGCQVSSAFSLQDITCVPRLKVMGSALAGDRNWVTQSRYTEGLAQAQEEFASASRWQFKVGLGLNVSRCFEESESEGGFFGFGAQPTGKRLQKDWQLDIHCGYMRAEHGESAAQIALEFRKNW